MLWLIELNRGMCILACEKLDATGILTVHSYSLFCVLY